MDILYVSQYYKKRVQKVYRWRVTREVVTYGRLCVWVPLWE